MVAAGWVAVGVEAVFTVTINCGAWTPDSREARLIAVVPGVDTPKLYKPSPATKEVTSKVTQVPLATAGEDPRVAPVSGALL